MKILSLILARGGSKRLIGKNIRILGGKPLVVWSINVAKDIPEICDILVSTDDPAIAEVCRDAGTLVPWLRPSELATDTATSVDAALHALDWYETTKGAVDGLLLLQPTSPFRTKETVRKGIELFLKHDQKVVLGVSPAHVHPTWSMKIEGEYLVPIVQRERLEPVSLPLPPAYVVNGSIYLISPAELRACRSFMPVKAVPLLSGSPQEELDIDTEFDFKMAEAMLLMGLAGSE